MGTKPRNPGASTLSAESELNYNLVPPLHLPYHISGMLDATLVKLFDVEARS